MGHVSGYLKGQGTCFGTIYGHGTISGHGTNKTCKRNFRATTRDKKNGLGQGTLLGHGLKKWYKPSASTRYGQTKGGANVELVIS